MSFLDKPQPLWWRKALFQIHLWVGLFAGLYAIVIGISGSILVFKQELAALTYPHLMRAPNPDRPERADLFTVMVRARTAYPDFRLSGGYLPGVGSDNVLVYMQGDGGRELFVMADPSDGHLLGALDIESSWLHWVSDLHIHLLLGLPGYVVNAIGAGLLLLLSLTGLVLWWPGIRRWPQALIVDFRRSWRRINFDLHSAAGFYTLAFVVMWSISGINFVFPQQVAAVVNVFSSVEGGREPEIHIKAQRRSADLSAVLGQAVRNFPAGRLAGVYLGEDANHPITVFLSRGRRNDFTRMDYVYFHPESGRQLAVWHSGVNPTLGSTFVFWLSPLHFGVNWGQGIKTLWALLGLSLPALAVTGALMYWNRYLGRRWKRLRSAAAKSEAPVA
ncbi:PepSY-associated TM helix domain-containing protein [Paludibaculum fermentans]|uniref:PepSY domain-containing protein n=1 Tax=Paludibaculum fermentans TaxID=1473598 RepID=A0A7S7NMY2_PALFE|nr:PepSY-associated TM helix domain-containing protein [Paludibaculum fermentans]QOY86592.1 PepSY domain-containing protein [Paludibaculum fermentans]